MSDFELPSDPSYADLKRFTQNILSAAHEHAESGRLLPSREAKAMYYSSLAQVCLVERLDGCLEALRGRLMDAAQHVGKVSERGTQLLIDASDRASSAAAEQGAAIKASTRQLVIATWVLASATVGLLLATAALYFKPGP